MNAVVLNGALSDDDALLPIQQFVTAALAGRGWTVEPVYLRDISIAYCQGCFGCWIKTPGVCQTKDAAHDVSRAIVRSDLLVILTRVTFGGYSSEIKKALDRSIGIVSPFFKRIDGEVHHARRYEKYPSLLAIGLMRDHDEDEARTFRALAWRNAINIHAPSCVADVVYADEPDSMRLDVGVLIARSLEGKRGAA